MATNLPSLHLAFLLGMRKIGREMVLCFALRAPWGITLCLGQLRTESSSFGVKVSQRLELKPALLGKAAARGLDRILLFTQLCYILLWFLDSFLVCNRSFSWFERSFMTETSVCNFFSWGQKTVPRGSQEDALCGREGTQPSCSILTGNISGSSPCTTSWCQNPAWWMPLSSHCLLSFWSQ